MKFSTSALATISLLLPAVHAHSYLSMPDPMGSYHDNAPLDPSGSNYPCKMVAPGESVKTYMPGVDDFYQITGSAVHGGGSCQISVTYDQNPTKDSVFKVIQSYEGSCPISAPGNLPANPDNVLPKIPLKFPMGLKAGEVVFAWTWFNKIGNREMYMNCARVTVGGSSSSDDVFDSLPDMFVANINIPQSQCTTKEGVDIQFPDAGNNVVVSSNGVNLGPACSSYNHPTQPKPVPSYKPSSAPSNGRPSMMPRPSSATYTVTSRPAFVGNPDAAMPTKSATTLVTAPKPTDMPGDNGDDNNDDNNTDNGSSMSSGNNSNSGSNSNNSGSGNSMGGGSSSSNNSDSGLNEWGAKRCTNKGTMICNSDKVTFNWCDENGSQWTFKVPLRTTCVPGTDINQVPPVGNGQQQYRRHLSSHQRRSHHHHI